MKTRRLLGLLLALSLIVSIIPTAAYADVPDLWDGTATDTSWYDPALSAFTIADAADLAGLAALVNAKTDFSGKTVTLTTDIDLDAKDWTPIGGSSFSFTGTFDGGGKTISNLYINGAGTAWYLGLFGTASAGSMVQNLTIGGCQIVDGASAVGAVVGATQGTVTGCSVSGSISGTKDIGGIAGLASVATVSDCSTTGLSITGNDTTGGIVGLSSSGLITGCSVTGGNVTGAGADKCDIGGIAGRVGYATIIRGCSVGATNTVSGDLYVGGIVGSASGDGDLRPIVQDCESLGAVSATGRGVGGIAGAALAATLTHCRSAGTVVLSAGSQAGGIVGVTDTGTVLEGSSSVGTVNGTGATVIGGLAGILARGTARDCYTGGSVIGTSRVGGIVGYVNQATVETCYSSAVITAGSPLGRVAALVDTTGVLRHCYFTDIDDDTTLGVGFCAGGGTVSDVTSKTADEFTSSELAWLLNTAGGTASNSETWAQCSPSPVFADDVTHFATYRIVLTNAATPLGAAYGTFYSDAASGAVALPLPAAIDPSHYFFGWYKDADYLIPRVAPTNLTSDVLLFGNFGDRIISLADCRAGFTGGEVPYTGTVTDNASGISSEGLTFTYYTDAGGTTKTTAANGGAASDGGAPARPGRYYVRATAAADAVKDIHAAASNYAAMTIVKPTYHGVSATQSEGGTVALSAQSVERHDSVTFTVTPDAGYRIADVFVNDVSVGAVERHTVDDVVANMTIRAVFRKIWKNPYADVLADAWYYDAVAFVSEHGLFRGIDSDSFCPDDTMTRGMAATVLLRLSGENASGQQAGFSDVPSDSWYAGAVAWANASRVAGGVGDTCFAPEASVTREQLAVMLFNYAKYAGRDTSILNGGGIDSFADAGEVSAWADGAMRWAIANELITGEGSLLHPSAAVTRAEVAAILQRFIERP